MKDLLHSLAGVLQIRIYTKRQEIVDYFFAEFQEQNQNIKEAQNFFFPDFVESMCFGQVNHFSFNYVKYPLPGESAESTIMLCIETLSYIQRERDKEWVLNSKV